MAPSPDEGRSIPRTDPVGHRSEPTIAPPGSGFNKNTGIRDVYGKSKNIEP
jgi:hypothetical protein